MPAEVTPVNLAERSSAFKELQIGHGTTCAIRLLGIDFDDSHTWDVLLIVPFKFFWLPEVHLCFASCFSPCDAAELSDLMQSWAGFGFCF